MDTLDIVNVNGVDFSIGTSKEVVEKLSELEKIVGQYGYSYNLPASDAVQSALGGTGAIGIAINTPFMLKISSMVGDKWRMKIWYSDGTYEVKALVMGATMYEFSKDIDGISIFLWTNHTDSSISFEILAGVSLGLEKSLRSVNTHRIYVGADIKSIALGSGWTTTADGYKHTSGYTDALVVAQNTLAGNSYLVVINSSDKYEDAFMVQNGSVSADPYNGTNTMYVGVKSQGGNISIVPLSTYVGTISSVNVYPIVNENDAVSHIDIAVNNVFGQNLSPNIAGFWNIAIGGDNMTLDKSVNGARNIAIGNHSLNALESGNRNIGIGTFSLSSIVKGFSNVGVGADSIYRIEESHHCVAVGKAALCNADKVEDCVALGYGAMNGEGVKVPLRKECVSIGTYAGAKSTDGNVSIGHKAGYGNTGSKNVFIGREAGVMPRSGHYNVVIGNSSDVADSVSKSIAIGFAATATKTGQCVIGNPTYITEIVLAGKTLHFNSDGSVTWS